MCYGVTKEISCDSVLSSNDDFRRKLWWLCQTYHQLTYSRSHNGPRYIPSPHFWTFPTFCDILFGRLPVNKTNYHLKAMLDLAQPIMDLSLISPPPLPHLRTCQLCLGLIIPLIRRSSATCRKLLRSSCATLTSPWYMNVITASMSLKDTPLR